VQIKEQHTESKWWQFWSVPRVTNEFEFNVDTGDGEAFVGVDPITEKVDWFEYHPKERKFLLPLWVAYPTYTSVTAGWRQGYGEVYSYKWHSYYRSLSDDEKAKYKQTFPPPDDEERCWQGFYESLLIDLQKTKNHLSNISLAVCHKMRWNTAHAATSYGTTGHCTATAYFLTPLPAAGEFGRYRL
jgi:hypothetical protein